METTTFDFRTGDIVNNGYSNCEVNRVLFDERHGWCVEYTDLDGGGFDRCEDITLVSRITTPSIYKIVEHSNVDALSSAVSAAILEGFKPIGGVSMSPYRYYMQAMLKE